MQGKAFAKAPCSSAPGLEAMNKVWLTSTYLASVFTVFFFFFVWTKLGLTQCSFFHVRIILSFSDFSFVFSIACRLRSSLWTLRWEDSRATAHTTCLSRSLFCDYSVHIPMTPAAQRCSPIIGLTDSLQDAVKSWPHASILLGNYSNKTTAELSPLTLYLHWKRLRLWRGNPSWKESLKNVR